MSREIRRVPASWRHPRSETGGHLPLYSGTQLIERLTMWHEEKAAWDLGYRRDFVSGKFEPKKSEHTDISYEEWDGECPDPKDYMPAWPDGLCTYLMMYQTTNEGTPISPAFETPEELARWLADNKASAFGSETATYEQWLATCRSGWAVGLVMDSKGTRSGVAFEAERVK